MSLVHLLVTTTITDTGGHNNIYLLVALFRIIHGSLPNDDYKELELLKNEK